MWRAVVRMKATIIYYSQSGNTEKVAYELAEKLQKAGWEVMPLLFEDVADFPEALDGIDVLGVGFPTFFGHPPKFVAEMIGKLDKVVTASAFVFTTYGGETAGDSLFDAASALWKRGYRILGGLKIEGSNDYPQAAALKINQGRPDDNDMLHVDKFVEKLVEAYSSGRRLDPAKLASSTPFFVENRGKPLAEVLEQMRGRVEGEVTFHEDQCLFCETCKKICPSRSITTGKDMPEFSWKCIDGMRCYHCVRTCPGKALTVEFPGRTPEQYAQYFATVADSPEEKRRAFIMA